MEFLFGIDPALNFAAGNGLNDLVHPGQKIVLLLFTLDAVVKQLPDPRETFSQCAVGTLGNLVPHQNADLIQLLPLAIEGQQGTDFKIARGDVEFF